MSDLLRLLNDLPRERVAVAANERLFCRDERVRHLFLVESGVIQLVRYQEDGSRTVMQRAQAGELVAQPSIFASFYRCDGEGAADTCLYRLCMAKVRKLLIEDAQFVRACAEHLAHEVHRSRARSEMMGIKRLSPRLDAWLSLHPLPPKGEWGALADDLGVTREALYRELSRRRGCNGEQG